MQIVHSMVINIPLSKKTKHIQVKTRYVYMVYFYQLGYLTSFHESTQFLKSLQENANTPEFIRNAPSNHEEYRMFLLINYGCQFI